MKIPPDLAPVADDKPCPCAEFRQNTADERKGIKQCVACGKWHTVAADKPASFLGEAHQIDLELAHDRAALGKPDAGWGADQPAGDDAAVEAMSKINTNGNIMAQNHHGDYIVGHWVAKIILAAIRRGEVPGVFDTKELQHQCKILNATIADLRAKLADTERVSAELERAATEWLTQRNTLTERVAELELEIADIEHAIPDDDDMRTNAEVIARAFADRDDYNIRGESLAREMEVLRAKLAETERDRDDAQGLIHFAETTQGEATAERDRLAARVAELEDEAGKARGVIAQLQRFKWNDENIRIMEVERDAARAERDKDLAEMRRFQCDHIRLSQELSAARAEADALRKQVASLVEHAPPGHPLHSCGGPQEACMQPGCTECGCPTMEQALANAEKYDQRCDDVIDLRDKLAATKTCYEAQIEKEQEDAAHWKQEYDGAMAANGRLAAERDEAGRCMAAASAQGAQWRDKAISAIHYATEIADHAEACGIVRSPAYDLAVQRVRTVRECDTPIPGLIRDAAQWKDRAEKAEESQRLTQKAREDDRGQLQQKCSDWGTYWRASDSHGVRLNIAQATELLQDALGVEVEIAKGTP